MEDVDWSTLSEQTKAEMEAGRNILKQNQARFASAMAARDAEEVANKPPEGNTSEADQAAAEAKPLSEAVPVQEREPVFPVAGAGKKAKT